MTTKRYGPGGLSAEDARKLFAEWVDQSFVRVGEYISPPRGQTSQTINDATLQLHAIWDGERPKDERRRNIWVAKPVAHAKEILKGMLNLDYKSDNPDVQAVIELKRDEAMKERDVWNLTKHTNIFFDHSDPSIVVGEEMASKMSHQSLLLGLLHEDGHDRHQLSRGRKEGKGPYEIKRINECMADAHMNRLSPFSKPETLKHFGDFLRVVGRSSDPEFSQLIRAAYQKLDALERAKEKVPEADRNTHPLNENRLRAIMENHRLLSLTSARQNDRCEVTSPLPPMGPRDDSSRQMD